VIVITLISSYKRPIDKILSKAQNVEQTKKGYKALCPVHDDHEPSLEISEGSDSRVLLNCWVCGNGREYVLKVIDAWGLKWKDLFPKSQQEDHPVIDVNILARSKRLLPDYLKELGVENRCNGVIIPYREIDGTFANRNRIRSALKAGDGSTWTRGEGHPIPYGIWRIPDIKKKHDYLIIVEGETDCWTLWYHDIPAIGIPGANMGKTIKKEHVQDFDHIYIWQEPDNGGYAFLKSVTRELQALNYKGKVFVISKEGIKDPNELHKTESDFLTAWAKIIGTATQYDPSATNIPTPVNQGRLTLTDMGNARRFVYLVASSMRYMPERNKWLYWDGNCWVIDKKYKVMQEAKETVRLIYEEAKKEPDERNRKEIAKHAMRSECENRLRAMVNLAKSEPEIPILVEELDKDPWLLGCKNGTINLRTGELLPSRKEDYITKLAPIVYDPNAQSSLFKAFLKRVLPNPDVRRYVQKTLGYSMTGDTSMEKLFFVYGPPATGKSTLLAAVSETLGDYAMTADFETFLQRDRSSGGARNDIARLAGSRFVLSVEVEDGRKLAEALINQLTGGDTVAARFLYSESFEFKPQFKLWLCANNRPSVSGSEGGIWRRMVQIPFLETIPTNERDPSVKAGLTNVDAHGPAIFNWLLEGCLLWQKEGLKEPDAVRELTEEYREESDVLKEFLEECCILDPQAQVSNSDIWQAYQNWCKDNSIRYPLGRKRFAQALLAKEIEKHRKSGTGSRAWIGVGLIIKSDRCDTWNPII